jgi:hypothetical protein
MGSRTGQGVVAEVDDEVEGAQVVGRHFLGLLAVHLDAALAHHLARDAGELGGRGDAGAVGFQDIAAVGAGEGFGHLTATGVPQTHKEDPALAIAQGLEEGHFQFRRRLLVIWLTG